MSTVCPRCELIRPQWHGDTLRCGCCGLVYNDLGMASRSGVYNVNGRDAQGGSAADCKSAAPRGNAGSIPASPTK